MPRNQSTGLSDEEIGNKVYEYYKRFASRSGGLSKSDIERLAKHQRNKAIARRRLQRLLGPMKEELVN